LEAAGVGLLGLAFAFFEVGSIKPSLLQAYKSFKISRRIQSNFGNNRRNLQVEQVVLIRAARRSL
jgi:hypothetical protein